MNIVIADDHPLFREALRHAVMHAVANARVSEADSAAALFGALERIGEVALVLLDLGLPDARGFSALMQMRASHPSIPVLIVSGREEPDIIARAIAHGAAGFVPKSASAVVMAQALHAVLSGGVWKPRQLAGKSLRSSENEAATLMSSLTPQQVRVLVMLCSGMPNKQIGLRLEVTEATVKAHMRAIMEKFGVSNRTQVVLRAQHLALDQYAESAERKYRTRSRAPVRNAG